jgi:hypothetical protein
LILALLACASPVAAPTCAPVDGYACYTLDASATTATIVTVRTDAPGLGPDEVETAITAPIEAALSDVAGVERVESQSGAWVSTISVTFSPNVPLGTAQQAVAARVLAARGLPNGATTHIDLLDACWRETPGEASACIARDRCATGGTCTKWAACSACEAEGR